MQKILFLLIFVGCSGSQFSKLSQNIDREIKKICLESSGYGKISVFDTNYTFSFDTGFESNLWLMAISFPLYPEQIFEVDLTNGRYTSEFESKIVTKKNRRSFKSLMKVWAALIYEIHRAKNLQEWVINNNILSKKVAIGRDTYAYVKFSNVLKNEYFTFIELKAFGFKRHKSLKLILNVRECLKKESIQQQTALAL
ncbi:MAG: hypothetical protein N4A33_11330 [Bacteriovoracaceae bacterium]|jgi:hypothetical protein|nr:hypothetical protein [Bacteriovoracaceae bacterium]